MKKIRKIRILDLCWTSSNLWFLGQVRTHNPDGIIIGSAVLHRWPQNVPKLYNGPPFHLPFPSKLPIPTGRLGPPSNMWFPGPTRVLNPNGISIDSAIFAGLTSVTDRQTADHVTQSVGLLGNNRPHLRRLRSTAMRPKILNKWTN